MLLSVSGQEDRRSMAHDETSHAFSAGFLLHPRGLGVSFKVAQRQTEKRWGVLETDVLTMRHPKEFRIRSSAFSTPGSYAFGKLNHTYFWRAGLGIKRELAFKAYKNTISADWNITAGPSLALLKPVYLDIFYSSPDNQTGYLQSERYDPDVHRNQNRIFGYSAFSKGLDEMKAQGGLYVKTSMQFDWGDYAELVQSLELGACVDLFPKNVPIMALAPNRKVFTSLYICLNIGNRW
ncbi:MAG: hypothetical protein EP332_07070 [Bacteroidetes bacterium]|nr:MAG: hypothetical protein EP332_07070 [Bacteroidota bacterium]